MKKETFYCNPLSKKLKDVFYEVKYIDVLLHNVGYLTNLK